MKNDDILKIFQNLSVTDEDKNAMHVFQTIYRRKWIIITIVAVFLGAAIAYNTFAPKQYVASLLLKKETANADVKYDQFKQMILSQNSDNIDTEMKLVKTSEVLTKVAKELKLSLSINLIEYSKDKIITIDDIYLNYTQNYLLGNPNGNSYPEFIEFETTAGIDREYCLVKKAADHFALYDFNDKMLTQSKGNSNAIFNLKESDMVISWENAPIGSKLYFSVLGEAGVVAQLDNSISVEKDEETSLFRLFVIANTPYAAQLIANTVGEKYKDTRIDQQKRSIRYTFDFIDKQLTEVADNLKNVEDNLQIFKRENKFVSVSENSTQLVDLLSRLEVEKVNVDLELNDYKNRLSSIESEYNSKGFFDQTYLTPENRSEAYTPFSSLLLKLADLEINRIEALNRKRENHPEVLKIDEQIDEIKNKLSNYNQNTLTAFRIKINTLEEKQKDLKNLVYKYSSQLSKLPAKETQYASLLREKTVYENVYTLLLDKREELRMAELSKLQDIEIVEAAHRPIGAKYPRKNFNIAASVFFGLITGLLFVAIKELVNRKKLNLEDLENEYSIPIFSIIPNYSKSIKNKIAQSTKLEDRFVTLMNAQNGFKETYRVLRTKIYSCCANSKVLMFTSCEENTGKSTVVANLAILLVKSNKRVLMIDCDLKRARLSNMFNISKNSPGLVNAINEKKINSNIYSLLKSAKNSNKQELHLLPPGAIKDNSSELLETELFDKLLENLNSYAYDYILVDTPPVTRVVDPLILAKKIKDTILVVRSDYTLKDSFKWGVQELNQAGTKIHGIVVNACEIENSAFKHRYGYGYEYTCSYSDEGTVNGNNGNSKNIKTAASVG